MQHTLTAAQISYYQYKVASAANPLHVRFIRDGKPLDILTGGTVQRSTNFSWDCLYVFDISDAREIADLLGALIEIDGKVWARGQESKYDAATGQWNIIS
jgi:hypothetical protein